MAPRRTRAERTVLSAQQVAVLRPALEALLVGRDDADRLKHDPLQTPHRYTDPRDQEVAALLASTLAFGRVSAFMPVLERILAMADARGGPRAWVEGFREADADELAPLVYRWNRGPDFALLARALRRVLAREGRLGAVLERSHRRSHPDIEPALTAGIAALRAAAEAEAGAAFGTLRQGFRMMLSSPEEGSACKRWNMLLRWMVRPTWPDLGLWALPPEKLILPLDTHTLSLSGMLGLTRRTDSSWRTAREITRNLARLDPSDPVKYDFALAHLGISGECQKAHVPSICARCPVVSVCQIGGRGSVGAGSSSSPGVAV